MRWKITIGFLLLLIGAVVFVYGATRHAVNVRIYQKIGSELNAMFWGDNAPISVFRDHKELRRPILHLIQTLNNCDGQNCW